MKISYVLLILIFFLFGCKDEFILEPESFEQVMVVDGMITNDPGPYTINLSITAPISSDEYIPLGGYVVTLYDNTGVSEVLTETRPGKYVTAAGGIQGIVGNEYRISILSPDGEEYRSDFQELHGPVEIESVYAENDTTISEDYPFKIPGFQFYTDSKLALNQDNYFLWSIMETFEFNSDYEFYMFETRTGSFLYSNEVEKYRTCWKTQKVKYLYTASTSNLNMPKITRQPLHFVGTDTKRLSKRYSILLTQYNICESAYKYWQEMEEMLSEDNFLVVTQPYNITGNIYSVNNSKEKVYGYFTVASVSQVRIFIDRPSANFYYGTCTVLTDPQDIRSFKLTADPPFYWTIVDEGLGLVVHRDCLDCTSEGGTIYMPDFWIY